MTREYEHWRIKLLAVLGEQLRALENHEVIYTETGEVGFCFGFSVPRAVAFVAFEKEWPAYYEIHPDRLKVQEP